MDYDRYDAFLHHIFKQTQGDAWFRPTEDNLSAGVCLRVDNGRFRVFPYENLELEPFETAVTALNPVVAVKIRSAAVHAALADVPPDQKSIYVDSNTRIQILETMLLLPHADKEQCAAFIFDERVLVVWSDDLDTIIPMCRDFEDRLIKLLWRSRPALGQTTSSLPGSVSGSVSGHSFNEKNTPFLTSGARTSTAMTSPDMSETGDPEKGQPEEIRKKRFFGLLGTKVVKRNVRPVRWFAPFYNGTATALAIFFMGSGIDILLRETLLDQNYIRFALCACIPVLFAVSLFFAMQIVTNISFAIGPIAQYHENSKYYSAIKPRSSKQVDNHLPHVTIQMPVYKESLETVLTPSIESLKKCMQTYARQGGTSNIFINDDGMQLISEAEREKRITFYANHGIGWVARPPHDGANADGFKRAGRFKKASNMNYGLALSLKMEKHLAGLQAVQRANGGGPGSSAASHSGYGSPGRWNSGLSGGLGNGSGADDEDLEEKALQLAVEEAYGETQNKHRPWAANARAARVGEIILIVDSDTIVPDDCLRDAARELAESPTVAVIQHESDVMQVSHNYFENGIAYFTRRINRAISMTCANGEVAPFVGHNAFLRWRAVQDAAFIDPADGKEKIWSESNVSEDFDMALRLQLRGYIIRWATYADGGFKEGVSLTVDDELNRWQKYAYGCSELLFNPVIYWFRRGPVTRQIHKFIWSSAPIHYKISMLSYMFSYYGIAGSVTIGVLNYVLLGFQLPVDGYYMHSFEIWLATTVVFLGTGNIGYTLLEYRLSKNGMFRSLITQIMWIPFFFIFFGGLSIHLSLAILSHLFSYNMTWAATIKEVERSNFFKEVPKIAKRFWVSFVVCFILTAAMIVLATPLVPVQWQVGSSAWAVIFPLAVVVGCHILFPIVLNPWLMIFSY